MKIWKLKTEPMSADDVVAAVRLGAVTGRGKTEASSYGAECMLPELDKAPMHLRRFWTPHELAADAAHA